MNDNMVGKVCADHGKVIEYKIKITEKNHYSVSYEDNFLIITAPKDYEKIMVEGQIRNRFLDHYYMLHDEEYRKYRGKSAVHLLGKPYTVKIKTATKDEVVVKDDVILIFCKKNTHSQHKAIYNRFLRKTVEEEMEKLLPDAINDFCEIRIPEIVVKPISGTWGYNKRYGDDRDHIAIHPIIGRYDPIYIKALLYHELCHCLVKGHRRDFYDLLDSKMPGASELEKEYKAIQYHYEAF